MDGLQGLEVRWGAPARRLENERGSISVWNPAPDVVVSQVRGHLAHAFAEEILAELEATRRTGRVVFHYHDWFGMEGYDVSAQRDLTAWNVKHRRAVGTLTIGLRSALVRMGVTVANVPLKGLITIRDTPETLYADIRARLGGRVSWLPTKHVG